MTDRMRLHFEPCWQQTLVGQLFILMKKRIIEYPVLNGLTRFAMAGQGYLGAAASSVN
jgi:hypothetical protein